jgi:hypothetical protein
VTASTDDGRHLSYANLSALWAAGAVLVVPIQGTPSCQVRLDPGAGEITLITEYSVPEPDVAGLRNVTFEPVTSGNAVFAELTVTTPDDVYGAYSFLATIADQLQVRHAPLVAAVASAMSIHREVLATRGALTLEKEVGLYGELLVLNHLFATQGVAAAIAAWQGPARGEHDFVLASGDLEVKTTTSEHRRHLISSLTQLEPRPSSPLHLVSVQLTRATAATGSTLSGLITTTRSAAGNHSSALDHLLDASGWSDGDTDLYRTHWTHRAQPAAYIVDASFPRLSIDIVRAGVGRSEAISDVSFRVDVSHLEPAQLSVLKGFATHEQENQ